MSGKIGKSSKLFERYKGLEQTTLVFECWSPCYSGRWMQYILSTWA